MALQFADRVMELTTVTSASSVTLDGAVSGHKAFAGTVTDGATIYYVVDDLVNGAWELCIGTYASGTDIITRTATLKSSEAGNGAVTFSAGTKNVYLTVPALREQANSVMLTPLASLPTTGATSLYMIVPENGVLSSAYFSASTALSASDTNYLTFTLQNLGQDGSTTTAMFASTCHTKATLGAEIVADTKWTMTLHGTAGNLAVNAGDRLKLTATATGTLGAAITYPVFQLNFSGA